MKDIPTFTIVIPIFNEEDTIPLLYERLTSTMKALKETYEILFIDDGSQDSSVDIIEALSKNDQSVKCISLSRNFGHQTAISAGIHYARGKATILMDGDLQDPPEVIPMLVEKWQEGYDVAYAVRRKRKENFLKKFMYKIFYRLLNKLSYIEIPLDSGDFSIIDKKIIHILNSMPERNRYIRGIRTWVGFSQVGVEYERARRLMGEPKYTFSKLFKLALDGIVSFSYKPLTFATHIGFFISFMSFIGAGFYFVYWLVKGDAPQGFTTLAILFLFLTGVQLIMLGIMGEYIGRIHDEVKNRPLFVVKKMIGVSSKHEY